MSEEYTADLITLVDEENNSYEFQILDAIETDDGRFVALLPEFDMGNENEEDGNYFIFEVVAENGNEELIEIDDEELLDKLAELFEARFAEMYGDVEQV